MRVAQVTCVYPPYGGGIGRVAYQYARELAQEHRVTVFTPRYYKGQTFVKTPGVEIKAQRPLINLGKAAWWPQLYGWLKEFDVVHLHYPFFGVQEWLTRLPASVKLIITYHMRATSQVGVKNWLFKADQRLFDAALGKRANKLLCATRDYWQAVAGPALGQLSKWQILPFGVGEEFTPGPPDHRLLERWKVDFNQPIILFVGTLDKAHEFKGLSVLLQAVAKLKVDFKLVVVGGGQSGNYKRQALELGLSDKIIWAGYVMDKDLPAYYRSATVLAFPSLNQAEAFGLVALQAMACAVPVVASDLPGVRELVQNNQVGLLVPPGNSQALAATLDGLLSAPALRFSLGQTGRRLVEQKYTWSKIGEELRIIYQTKL